VNNLPFESEGLASARRVDPLEVIPSPKSATKQERRRAYCRKRSGRLQSPQFKCGPPAVEPRSTTSPSSGFTNCESASSDSETATCNKSLSNSNFDCEADFDIHSISYSQKVGVIYLASPIKASTAASNLNKFPAKKPFKCSVQNSCRMVLKEIPIPTWPTHYSDAYN